MTGAPTHRSLDRGSQEPYLEVRREMVGIEEDSNLDFINSMVKKYLGPNRHPYQRSGDGRLVIVVEPRPTQMGR